MNSAAWAWLLLCEVCESPEREEHAKSVGSREISEACTELVVNDLSWRAVWNPAYTWIAF
jgi:hypothetical protein